MTSVRGPPPIFVVIGVDPAMVQQSFENRATNPGKHPKMFSAIPGLHFFIYGLKACVVFLYRVWEMGHKCVCFALCRGLVAVFRKIRPKHWSLTRVRNENKNKVRGGLDEGTAC